jgi:hypothetical protein
MRFSQRPRHVIDLLFPVALFFVFALSALTVILLATHVYQKTTEESTLNYTAQTSLSYIREKVHQADEAGQISFTQLEDCQALTLTQTQGDTTYITYIYAFDGSLRELFVREGTAASPADGREILPVSSFSIEKLGDRLYRFSCETSDGQARDAVVALHSYPLS